MDMATRELNRKWLDEQLGDYPHRCHTNKTTLGPLTVERRLPGVAFIRCAVGRQTEWGFKSEKDLAAFKGTFVTAKYRG